MALIGMVAVGVGAGVGAADGVTVGVAVGVGAGVTVCVGVGLSVGVGLPNLPSQICTRARSVPMRPCTESAALEDAW